MDRTLIRAGIAATLAVGAAGFGAAANPTAAAPSGATVTEGEFAPFAVGAGLDIDGEAHMVRTGDGRTIVQIVVRGLEPGVTYPSHVHAAPCGTGDADGHYMRDPSGPVTPPNEIWPGPITANAAGVATGHVVADFPAGPTAVSVVVHRPGAAPNKIACADLG